MNEVRSVWQKRDEVELSREGGGFRLRPSLRTFCPLLWHHRFIWSAPQAGSKKRWNRKYQIFSRNCALQERCGFQVFEKPSVRRFPVLARSMKRVTTCQLQQLQLTWTDPQTIQSGFFLTVTEPGCSSFAIGHFPSGEQTWSWSSRRLGIRKQYCHTCWGFWDFSFVFLAFLLSTLPCCCWGGGRSRPCMNEDGGACEDDTVRWLWLGVRDVGW